MYFFVVYKAGWIKLPPLIRCVAVLAQQSQSLRLQVGTIDCKLVSNVFPA